MGILEINMKLRCNLKQTSLDLNSGPVQARPRPGQARLHRTWIDHVKVYVMGPTSTRINFYRDVYFGHVWTFSTSKMDPGGNSTLKNGIWRSGNLKLSNLFRKKCF